MRLDRTQEKALFNAINDVEGEVFLFGSRIDDTKKGGDVDILIFSKKSPLMLSLEISRKYFMECEEKIDVIVFDPDNMTEEQEEFFNSINKIKIK